METKLDFDDVIIRPRRSPTASRSAVDIEREYEFYHSPKVWKGFPIIAANMDCTGSFEMGKSLSKVRAITCLHKFYDIIDINDFFLKYNLTDYVWYSLGIIDTDINKLVEFKKLTCNPEHDINLCVDVANGYTDYFVKKVAVVRDMYPSAIIMAGNVATPDMAQELIIHGGADIVKVGIGPGSACTTRLVTGVGYPQLSAVQECSKQVHGLKNIEKKLGLICSDGGCRTPGDICKAFAGGADFVMLGGMLAGTDECEGEWKYSSRQIVDVYPKEFGGEESVCRTVKGDKTSLKFYGMSSYEAQDKHYGERKSHRASEGRSIEVPYKGLVLDVVKEIEGGIRSCCAYTGATRLKDLSLCAEFIKVNRVHNNTNWST